MLEKNHLHPVPYKNNKNQQYDIALMPGYTGIEYVAKKYAIDPPLAVAVELVYSTDYFKPIKKTHENKIENYVFEIKQPFDRGTVMGGFGYIEYSNPEKNKLIMMSKTNIEKRKPSYAAAEFWGGTKTIWEKGQKIKVETDGWYDEMCLKTIKREVYSSKHIPRDPKKVDDDYQYMKMKEAGFLELQVQSEIDANANRIIIDPANFDENCAPNVDTSIDNVVPKQTEAPTPTVTTPTLNDIPEAGF